MKQLSITEITDKYRDLFSPDCLEISDCPQGWVHIIGAFCASLDDYKKSYRSEPKKCLRNSIIQVLALVLTKVGNQIRPENHIVRLYTPAPEKTFRAWLYDETRKLWCKMIAKKKYHRVDPPNVKIAQFKQKFGGLRIYCDYSDERTYGMIDMAESLASKTCEETVSAGSLCIRGGWYRTLSAGKALDMDFKPLNKNDQ